jgi:hypothetical protein
MSGIAAEGLSAPVTGVPADALHGFHAGSPLADDARAVIGAPVQAAVAATDHAASSAIVAGIGSVTLFPAPEARAILGEWASPAGVLDCGLADTAPHLTTAVAVPVTGETLVTMTGTAQELNTAVTPLNEMVVLIAGVSGAPTMGNWESGEMVGTDGGGQAHLAAHMTSAIVATIPSMSAFAGYQLNGWDSGHNLAESLTLQLAGGLTNLSAKDAHGFTVL